MLGLLKASRTMDIINVGPEQFSNDYEICTPIDDPEKIKPFHETFISENFQSFLSKYSDLMNKYCNDVKNEVNNIHQGLPFNPLENDWYCETLNEITQLLKKLCRIMGVSILNANEENIEKFDHVTPFKLRSMFKNMNKYLKIQTKVSSLLFVEKYDEYDVQEDFSLNGIKFDASPFINGIAYFKKIASFNLTYIQPVLNYFKNLVRNDFLTKFPPIECNCDDDDECYCISRLQFNIVKKDEVFKLNYDEESMES